MEDFILPSFYSYDLSTFKMPFIVIYKHPNDYPSKFVARLLIMDKCTRFVVLDDTLEGIRSKIPLGLICNPRDIMDDHKIVESYF